jgi:hypothetical protein
MAKQITKTFDSECSNRAGVLLSHISCLTLGGSVVSLPSLGVVGVLGLES